MGTAPRMPGSGIKFAYKELFIGVALYGVSRYWVTTPTGVVYAKNTERFSAQSDGSGKLTVKANANGYYARLTSGGTVTSKSYYSKGATLGSAGPTDGSGTYMYWAAL